MPKVRTSGGRDLFGLDAELYSKQKAKHNPELESNIINWIEEITGISSNQCEIGAFLKNGIVLCKLANCIEPNSIPKINEKSICLMERENIQLYVNFCEKIGVTSSELFSVSDLYERKGIQQVMINIVSLARIVQSKNGYNGPTLLGLSNKNENLKPAKHWPTVRERDRAKLQEKKEQNKIVEMEIESKFNQEIEDLKKLLNSTKEELNFEKKKNNEAEKMKQKLQEDFDTQLLQIQHQAQEEKIGIQQKCENSIKLKNDFTVEVSEIQKLLEEEKTKNQNLKSQNDNFTTRESELNLKIQELTKLNQTISTENEKLKQEHINIREANESLKNENELIKIDNKKKSKEIKKQGTLLSETDKKIADFGQKISSLEQNKLKPKLTPENRLKRKEREEEFDLPKENQSPKKRKVNKNEKLDSPDSSKKKSDLSKLVISKGRKPKELFSPGS